VVAVILIELQTYYYFYVMQDGESFLRECALRKSGRGIAADGGPSKECDIDLQWTSGKVIEPINVSLPLPELHPCLGRVQGSKWKPVPDGVKKSITILEYNPTNTWKVSS